MYFYFSLIDAKHPKGAEIERRLISLNKQWDVLRELAAAREKQLADAVEAYQVTFFLFCTGNTTLTFLPISSDV